MKDVDIRPIIALAVVLLVAWLAIIALLWLHRPSRALVGPALRLVPDVVVLVQRVLADPLTPLSVRIAFVVLLAWLVSPIDPIPEFLPVIGPIDDLIVAAIVLRWAARRVGPDRMQSLWPGSDEGYALLSLMF
jgi:uncharacterized membrane protein YkvA (DUF1232 family)